MRNYCDDCKKLSECFKTEREQMEAMVKDACEKFEPEESSRRICKNCEHMRHCTESFGEFNECHRYPPTCINATGGFPRVREDDYCGEFEFREE